jgi:hypothetical protein
MKLTSLLVQSAGFFLLIAPAFAELSLPVNLDFQDETVFPVGKLQSNEDFRIYIEPSNADSGIEIATDPDVAGNNLLVVCSNGTSRVNRLKIWLPELNKPFEYQFRCRVEGVAPGLRSLLTFYAVDEWDKPARILIPWMDGNILHGVVVDGKFQSVQRDLSQWTTIKVAVNTDGNAATPDTYSLFVDEQELLSNIPMERNFDMPISIAEIALDFDNDYDVMQVKFLIDDIQVGSPSIKTSAPAR